MNTGTKHRLNGHSLVLFIVNKILFKENVKSILKLQNQLVCCRNQKQYNRPQ